MADAGSPSTSKGVSNLLGLALAPEKEPWHHGVAERAVAVTQPAATTLLLGDPSLSVADTLNLAASAANSSLQIRGYSPHQWAFGRGDPANDHGSRGEFGELAQKREDARQAFLKADAQRGLSVLQNNQAQPIREELSIGEHVMV